MELEQKKISILFLDSSPNLSLDTAEVQKWLDQQFEIGLIAQTTAEVIPAPLSPSASGEIWQKVAEAIIKQKEVTEAFVVIAHLESLLTTSAALSFMLQGLDKPLIFTSSPNNTAYEHIEALTKDFGIRANLLNALQVATMDIPEPAIVFGNRIIRATRAIRTYDSSINLFQSFQTPLLGNIDFGVHLSEQENIGPVGFQPMPVFEHKLFTLDVLSDLSQVTVPEGVKGIISRIPLTTAWMEQYAKGRPVLIWSGSTVNHPLAIQVNQMTWETAVVKFGWILAQTQDVAQIRQLMLKNFIGELGE
ncbi:MAG: asparaginase domain-containing protein [Patescibacteria group bacterium]